MSEKWLQSQYIHQGEFFSLRSGQVALEDGKTAQREIIEHNGGAAVVPVLSDYSVVLVRQFRISIGQEILEIPGGRLLPGESPETRAKYELEEEVGYRAGRLIPLVTFYPSPGYTNEKVHIYLGLDLQKTQQNLDPGEKIEIVILSLAEIKNMLVRGEFIDGNMIIAMHKFLDYFKLHTD